MIPFELVVKFPSGTVLVGGYSAVPKWLDAVHASDKEGKPVVPATALRGALRESLEALLRGVELPACQGGTGLSPGDASDAPRRCALDEGRPCKACRLFGQQRDRLDPGERSFSGLILGQASLTPGPRVEWQDVHSVAITRSHRSAEDGLLFNRRVPALAGRELVARGWLLDDELRPFLVAAVMATTHVGSGRSRGLARIDLELRVREETSTPRAAPITNGGETWVRLELLASAAIGGPAVGENLRDARGEIPGSTLRGAIGFALARSLPEPDSHASFQALVGEDGAAFGFLYPSDHASASRGELAAPWPVTAKACKVDPNHPVVDTLFDRIGAALVTTPAQALKLQGLERSQCQRCKEPLRGASGTRGAAKRPVTRLVTRVALDRRSGSASDGKLFSHVLLEAGATFEGPVRRVPAGGAELLAKAASQAVFVGRGTSAGLGEARLTLLDPPTLYPLKQRGERFQKALRKELGEMELPADRSDRLVPITLLSPMLTAEGDDGTKALADALGLDLTWLVTARRFTREGGWDQRAEGLRTEQAVAAGAVFVAELAHPWMDSLAALDRLERTGAGRRLHQGFGHLICFDPFIVKEGK